MKPPSGHRLRTGRYSEANRIYSVSTVCHGRQNVFCSDAAAQILATEIQQRETENECANLCFVIMPDHAHWLLQLKDGANLSKVVARTKGRSAVSVNRLFGRSGRLWQPGFHDHAVRREEHLESLANYIIHNPVRAGIVDKPDDYLHWWSAWCPRK